MSWDGLEQPLVAPAQDWHWQSTGRIRQENELIWGGPVNPSNRQTDIRGKFLQLCGQLSQCTTTQIDGVSEPWGS